MFLLSNRNSTFTPVCREVLPSAEPLSFLHGMQFRLRRLNIVSRAEQILSEGKGSDVVSNHRKF